MSLPTRSQGDVVNACHATLRTLQGMLHELSSEKWARRSELEALHQQAAGLRAEVTALREQIASLHRQLMRLQGELQQRAAVR